MLEPREHLVPDPAFDGHFNVLRAYVAPLDVAGVKVVGDYHGNYKLGLPSELALLTLYDPRTGVPRAILDATAITEWRTGAVTALGGRHLARAGAKVLGHVGARGTAFANVSLLDRVHDYDEIRVTSARPESREAFARAARARRSASRSASCDTVEETVRGADVVVEATRLTAPEPILRTEWIAPAALVMPYGTMSAVELSLTVDHGQGVRRRLGPVQGRAVRRAARARRGRAWSRASRSRASWATSSPARGPGRESDDERILFWHRGLATTDIALGQAILDRAVEQDVGTLLPYR